MAVEPSLEQKTDQELVPLTLENQDNFLYLVNRYEKKLFSFIKRISNVSNEEAEDLLQEIFIKAYQNLNGFDTSLKFSSWIYRITRNHVISHYRKVKNKPESNSFELNEEIFDNLASGLDINKEVDHQILKQKIFKALDGLKPKYKEVIILKYFEEKNYQEISDIIKKPSGTVGTLLNRAKKQFGQIFKDKEK
jgi:RNA polymerase sigma-70 factor, ECF subfamily